MANRPSDPSVAIVVLDTLRKDVFDDHFGWLEGRRYERAYATANWTVPSHASLFCGRYASELGVHAKSMDLDCPEQTLAEALNGAGYTTRAFSANPNVSRHFDFDRGFEEFTGPTYLQHLNEDGVVNWRAFGRGHDGSKLTLCLMGVWEAMFGDYRTISSLLTGYRVARNDSGVISATGVDEAISYVDETRFGDREFLFVNLMEAHEPYEVPAEYRTVSTPPDVQHIGDFSMSEVDGNEIRAAYDDCARYLSDKYRQLFGLLDGEFDYVITTSDHGEMLGEHSAWGHEHGVYPQLTRVPLVITGPGMSGSLTNVVSLIDLHETVASLGDVETDGDGYDQMKTDGEVSRLTEYLGLTDWRKRGLEEQASMATIDSLDEPLRGVATSNGYGFESRSGFETGGDADCGELRDALSCAVDGLDIRDTEGREEIPEELESHLRDLGYA